MREVNSNDEEDEADVDVEIKVEIIPDVEEDKDGGNPAFQTTE